MYLTKIGPENSRKDVLMNNYDDTLSKVEKTRRDKADYAVAVKLSEREVEKCRTQRDVYKLKDDGDLDLRDKEYSIIKRKDKK